MSIKVSTNLVRPRAFLGVSFDDKDALVCAWYENLLRACGFEPVTAEPSEHLNLGEKVRRQIRSCDVACFVLTPRQRIGDSDRWSPPPWIPAEIGIAYDAGMRFAVFAEKAVAVEGIIRHIEDYTRFERTALHEEMHLILAAVLSLRLPTLQDAIEVLLAEKELAPIEVLTAFRRLLSTVKEFKQMAIKIPESPVVTVIRRPDPLLILGHGGNQGILLNSLWRIIHITSGIESEIGRARVSYVQPAMSQAILVDDDLGKFRDAIGDFDPDGAAQSLKDWRARPLEPSLLTGVTAMELDRFISVIDDLLSSFLRTDK